jgi:uncharacterized protein
MKQLLFLVLALGLLLQAQSQNVVNPYPRTINVNGSAEMEVIPDEIYVHVHLKEYEKKGSGKISIDKIKTDFLAQVRQLGIPDSAVSIASYEGNDGNVWWKKKKKDPQMTASITYQLKLNSSAKIDQLVNVLDDDATEDFQIVRTSHSRILEFRKQLKIAAVKAAKEKAQYLAAAIDEKVGEAITISEPSEVSMYNPYSNNVMMNRAKNANVQSDQEAEGQGVDFKKMKLKFEVKAVFALKNSGFSIN